MIDLKIELQNFPPMDMQKLTDTHGELPDNIRNSIMFYNKAIDNMRMGSEDIAIIELKKAVQLNSDFHEAMNLLGICYLYINDSEKAEEIFSKVMELEKNGIKAMQLSNLVGSDIPKINTSSDKAKQASVRRQDAITLAPNQKQGSAKKNSSRLLTSGIVLGIVLSSIIFIILYGTVLNKGIQNDGSDTLSIEKLTSEINELTKNNNQLTQQLKNVQEHNAELTEKLNTDNANPGTTGGSGDLAKALEALINNKFIEAADLFFTLEKIQLGPDEAAILQNHKEITYSKASRMVYDLGIGAYNKNDYQTAVTNLEKVVNYGGDHSYITNAEYTLGKSYSALNEKDKANHFFNDIITKYPTSDFAKWSRTRIVN